MRKTKFSSVIIWVALALAVVTVVGAFAALFPDSGGGVVDRTTRLPSTTVNPVIPPASEESPSTEAPPVTTLPPVITGPVVLGNDQGVSGQVLNGPESVQANNPIHVTSISLAECGVFGDSTIGEGEDVSIGVLPGYENRIKIPITVATEGLYRLHLLSGDQANGSLRLYADNESIKSLNTFECVEDFGPNKTLTIDIYLAAGKNDVLVWTSAEGVLLKSLDVYFLQKSVYTNQTFESVNLTKRSGGILHGSVACIAWQFIEIVEDGEYIFWFVGGGNNTTAHFNLLDATGTGSALFSAGFSDSWGSLTDNENNISSGLVPEGIKVTLSKGTYCCQISSVMNGGAELAIHSFFVEKLYKP